MTDQMSVEAAIEAVDRCKFIQHESFRVDVINDDDHLSIYDHVPRREIVHCFLGSFGADWDAADVIGLIGRSETRYWDRHIFGGECLVVISGGKRYFFDTVTPMKLED